MIEAGRLVDALRARGLERYAGVPCSFLTPFIDRVLDDPRLAWIAAANEGDAVAAAAGSSLGGRPAAALMQNSGLGNAVNPLTSLCWPFRIPVLLIVTWRGDPELRDEPQHRLMGAITPRVLEAMEVPWALLPEREAELEPVLERAFEHLARERRPFALVVRKGRVAGPAGGARPLAPPERPPARVEAHGAAPRASRAQALERVLAGTAGARDVVIASTGHAGRELCALDDRPQHLYMVGSMGCASSLGLGLALARPDRRVVVIDGDGALLMRLGNLATVGAYGGPNLLHLCLDNGVHDSTGGQGTVSPGVDLASAAAACGYARAWSGEDVELVARFLAAPPPGGPGFLHLRIRPGARTDLPRPELGPEEVRRRLEGHLGAAPVALAGER